jgi:hypothetical protein
MAETREQQNMTQLPHIDSLALHTTTSHFKSRNVSRQQVAGYHRRHHRCAFCQR